MLVLPPSADLSLVHGLDMPSAMSMTDPTIPAHLRDHDPAVALVLALYDVPEIRARMNP